MSCSTKEANFKKGVIIILKGGRRTVHDEYRLDKAQGKAEFYRRDWDTEVGTALTAGAREGQPGTSTMFPNTTSVQAPIAAESKGWSAKMALSAPTRTRMTVMTALALVLILRDGASSRTARPRISVAQDLQAKDEVDPEGAKGNLRAKALINGVEYLRGRGYAEPTLARVHGSVPAVRSSRERRE